MTVEAGIRAFLDIPGVELRPPPPNITPAMLRAAMADAPPPPLAPVSIHATREIVTPGPGGRVKVRLYYPSAADNLPLIVFFHGGGFVLCSLETHEGLCRELANRSGCAVASVDYRLAPETAFPGPLEDCYAGLRFLASAGAELGFDVTRLAVAGDSAGGNLAAATALLARERGGPRLSYQALLYPMTDPKCTRDSMQQYGAGYFLTRDIVHWFWQRYLPREELENPLAAVLHANDLTGLPPATIVSAEYDPLRDQGEAYASGLRAAGVPVVGRRYLGMIHGFMSLPYVTAVATRAIADVTGDLRSALG